MNPRARPRSASNQPKIAREYASGDAPMISTPRIANTIHRCQMFEVNIDSETTAHADAARHVTITRAAPTRSSSRPSHGAETADNSVIAPYAVDADSRDQEK